MKRSKMLVTVAVIFLIGNPVLAGPPPQDAEFAGEAYTVRPGDTLGALAREFYGGSRDHHIIVDGTNLMSLRDESFTFILDPDRLQVGQILWIPASPEDLPQMPQYFEGLELDDLLPELRMIDESTLKLDGSIEILADFDAYFIRYAERHPDLATIVVTSYGGEVLQWLKLADWVQQRGLDLVVQDFCLSSCANYLFTAARHKTIRPGSLVAWHGDAGYSIRKRNPEPDPEPLIQIYMSEEHMTREEATQLVEGFLSYDKEIDRRTEELFSNSGVDPAVMMAGYTNGNKVRDSFTMPKKAMESYGITNLSVEEDITSQPQLQRIVRSIAPDLAISLIPPTSVLQ